MNIVAHILLQNIDPAFFKELGAADVICGGESIGVLGVVHPEVLQNFELKYPVAALELKLHPFI